MIFRFKFLHRVVMCLSIVIFFVTFLKVSSVEALAQASDDSFKKLCKPQAEKLIGDCKGFIMTSGQLGSLAAEQRVDNAGDGSTASVKAALDVNKIAGEISAENATKCEQMSIQCVEVCERSEKYHYERLQELQSRPADDPQVIEHNRSIEASIMLRKQACPQILAMAIEEGLQSMNYGQRDPGLQAAHSALQGANGEGEGWWDRNQDWVLGAAGGAAVTAGGLCLLGSLCDGGDDDDDDDDKDNNNSADNGQVNCLEAKSVSEAQCESHFLNSCMANTKAQNCGAFNKHYCGIGSSGTGAGTGSSFCDYQIASKYCEDTGNAACPSCQQLAQSKNPVCAQNPTQCLPQMSNSQLNQAKNVCPTDPIFSTMAYIANNSGSNSGPSVPGSSIKATNSDANEDEDVQDLSELDGSKEDQYADVVKDKGGVTTTFAVNPQGVAPQHGANLFGATNQVYAKLCSAGSLNNCGPRR